MFKEKRHYGWFEATMKTRLKWLGAVGWEANSDSGHKIIIDGAPSIGGKNEGCRPMELVLKGLCGCSAMDVMSMLTKQRQNVTSAEIEAEAQRAESVPAVFTAIHLTYRFTGPSLKAIAVERAVRLSMEKYCSVTRMLEPTVEITYCVELNSVSLSEA